jgi:hypothetical protein
MKIPHNKLCIPAWGLDRSVYIYTLPKAGTYLLSSTLEELGLPNSGFHISFTSYLDTLAFSPEISRKLPSSTRVNSQYIKTFKQCAGKMAFGHLSPAFLPPGIFKKTNVIASYRDPCEILISEFNDFRFIRNDVAFCSKDAEPNDAAAFTRYLERQAPVIRDIMIEMCRYLDSFSNTLYRPKYSECAPVVIDYNRLKDPDYLVSLDQLFDKLLPQSKQTFTLALASTFVKPTKTKSSGYNFDVQKLWDSHNNNIIKQLRLKRIYRHIVEQANSIVDNL